MSPPLISTRGLLFCLTPGALHLPTRVKRRLFLRTTATDPFTHPEASQVAGAWLGNGHFVLPSVSSSSCKW